METEYIDVTIEKTKKIALIAHDGKKAELLDWAVRNKEILQSHFLCGTGTTGRLIQEHTGLPVQIFQSGPLGGDQQIGARIVDGKIDMLIFIWDPMEAQPHDPDIKALLRVAAVWNIPVACNECSADYMLTSPLMSQPHGHRIPDYSAYLKGRV